jgi:hypothetical protein
MCDQTLGCTAQPTSTSCDDGNACTVGDHCDAAACVPGAAVPCDDGNPCTADRCDPIAGCAASALPDGSTCVALDQCRGPAHCVAGACDAGPQIECRDGDFCTDDRCDSATGCYFPEVSGLRRSTCRLDEARALLAGAPEGARTLSDRLGRRLDRATTILNGIDLGGPPRRAKRAFRRARRVLRGFAGLVSQKRGMLGAALGRNLRRSAELAIASAILPADR